MALVIKSIPDLLKYLQTRKELVDKNLQAKSNINPSVSGISRREHLTALSDDRGQSYAFDEAIRAVEALIAFETPPAPVKPPECHKCGVTRIFLRDNIGSSPYPFQCGGCGALLKGADPLPPTAPEASRGASTGFPAPRDGG